MNEVKVLVACEESQRVCTAFRARGHEAYSADIQEPSGGHPEWHILGDVLEVLNPQTAIVNGEKKRIIAFHTMDEKMHVIDGQWDLIIAHPPCTYLSNAGARHLYPKGILNEERLVKGIRAKDFFMRFYLADCEKIAIENPTPSGVYQLPDYTQVIQPYMFGHPFKKRTCLWLKGLQRLEPTDFLNPDTCESTKIKGNWFNAGGVDRQRNRSKTFEGIANAMAEQWG